ncbi:MAG: ABC transporter ATP-binding protein [Staphylothermus sp.]|nr:ABC transporter ATP-binding protein [Staphylothermus sp.]
MSHLLKLENVRAYYVIKNRSSIKEVKAVDDVSLTLDESEIVGIVGESGCGKSTLTNVILMNIKPPLKFISGKVILWKDGKPIELNKLSRDRLKKEIWGREISIIPQFAMNALVPTYKVRRIITDIYKSHYETNSDEEYILNMAAKRFKELGLPEKVLNMYPFELSGGMKQRVIIAIATLMNPKLLVADEPTSALDVITQKMVLKTLLDIYHKGFIKSIIFVSHDIATVRQIATRLVVMYAGKIIEDGPVEEIISNPMHPYTKYLIRSVLTPERTTKRGEIVTVPGFPPDLSNPPSGCRFHPRCSYKRSRCLSDEPHMLKVNDKHYVACWLYS